MTSKDAAQVLLVEIVRLEMDLASKLLKTAKLSCPLECASALRKARSVLAFAVYVEHHIQRSTAQDRGAHKNVGPKMLKLEDWLAFSGRRCSINLPSILQTAGTQKNLSGGGMLRTPLMLTNSPFLKKAAGPMQMQGSSFTRI